MARAGRRVIEGSYELDGERTAAEQLMPALLERHLYLHMYSVSQTV